MKLKHVIFDSSIAWPWQSDMTKVAVAGEYRKASDDGKRPAEVITITANEGWVFVRHSGGEQRCVPSAKVLCATPMPEEQKR